MPPRGNELLADLTKRQMADPEGYEVNRDLGLEMFRFPKFRIPAEQYIAKAVACERQDEFRERLLFSLGSIHEYKGEYQEAADCFTELSRTNIKYLASLGEVRFKNGEYDEAGRIYAQIIKLTRTRAEHDALVRKEPVTQVVFPYNTICTRFGEMALKIDLLVKARILGLSPPVNLLMPAPLDIVVNRALMDCWKNAAAEHLTVIYDNTHIEWALKTYGHTPAFLDWYDLPDGRVLHRSMAYTCVQRQWEAEGRPPLLEMPRYRLRESRKRLAEMGLPEDAWFVCLHVRSPGMHDEEVPWDHNRLRNAEIDSYLPVIEEIAKRGGWVVRIGDPSMPPMPPAPNTVDYAHDNRRTEWSDLYCLSNARFMIATPSGPFCVATAFGVPVLGTNWFPMGFWPFSGQDMFIHKLMREAATGRYLDIAESVVPPFIGSHFPGLFEKHGIEIEENTPEDIVEAAVEMMDRLDGRLAYSNEDEALQARYRELADYPGVGVNARSGLRFLRKHGFLTGA